MTRHLSGVARQELLDTVRARYEAGGQTIREIAAVTGYSYTATRQQLLTAGVVLRPRHTLPIVLGPGQDELRVGCPKCGAGAGERCQVEFGRRARRAHVARKRTAVR